MTEPIDERAIERRARRVGVAILAVAAVILLIGIGGPLMDPDEARFAQTSVEMAGSGDLVVPRFEGRPRLVKPPLLHWLQSGLFRAVGPEEWAARLPSVLATLVSVWLVGLIAGRRFGGEAAPWAMAIFGCMPLVMLLGRLGTLDALLSLHVLAIVVLDLRDEPLRPFQLGCLTGLAFLVKGPIGVLLPLLILLAGRTAAGRDIVPRLAGVGMTILGWCVVVLPWGLALLQRMGGERIRDVLWGEVGERYLVGSVHVEPFWFYAPVLALGFLPWAAPLLAGLFRAVLRAGDPGSRTARYAGAGLVVCVLFLSLGQGKVATYVLPLAPLAALVVVWEFGESLRRPWSRNLGTPLLAATLGALAVALPFAAVRELPAGTGTAVAVAIAGLYGGATLVCLPALWRRDHRRVYGAAAVSTAGFLIVAAIAVLPDVARHRTAAGLVVAVPELHRGPVATVDMQVPSLTFYLERVPEVVPMAGLADRIDRGDGASYVFDVDDLPNLPDSVRPRLESLGSEGKYEAFRIRGPSGSP